MHNIFTAKIFQCYKTDRGLLLEKSTFVPTFYKKLNYKDFYHYSTRH